MSEASPAPEREGPRAETRADYARRLLRVQDHISANLVGTDVAPLEAETLARLAGMSLHHFHRVFKAQTNESVMGYTRRLRMEQAARQLRYAERSVADIAFDVGYGSHEAFTRAFRRHFGCSPRTYRGEPQSARMTAALQDAAHTPLPDVSVRREPAKDVLFMRHTGPYLGVSAVWNDFVQWSVEHRAPIEAMAGTAPRMLALVHDDPDVTPPTHLRYDACFLLTDAGFPLPPGAVGRAVVPAARYAVMVHEGAYDTLAETYLALIGRWFVDAGYVPAAQPVIEHYMNGPHDTDPDALRTEILVAIEERGFMQ